MSHKSNLPEGMTRAKLLAVANYIGSTGFYGRRFQEDLRAWAEQIPSGFCEHGEDIDKWCFGCDYEPW